MDINASIHAVNTTDSALPDERFEELLSVFPLYHFNRLLRQDFPFYRTTFWFPLDREPTNVFERTALELRQYAEPPASVTGVEWWFSVSSTNTSPMWLLNMHFDRNDIEDRPDIPVRHPDRGSVLFLNAVPYGELVVSDQEQGPDGPWPPQASDMRFILPEENRYAVFPGHLMHGVIGRLWRPELPDALRVTMAVNWWTKPPEAQYMQDSASCMDAFDLSSA